MSKQENQRLDDAISSAEDVLAARTKHQPTRVEQTLNTLGNTFQAVSNDYYIDAAVSSPAYSVLKDQVNNFVENSKILMNVMDELGKAHPFVQVAVSVFKIGLALELARRENDEKVVALYVEMNDMMRTLAILRGIASPKTSGPDGITIEDRMRDRMVEIAESIKRCTRLCDSYYKRHLAIRILTSVKWQSRFSDVASEFEEHKQGIRGDLSIHTSVSISTTNSTLEVIHKKMDVLMEIVFTHLRSDEERDHAAWIEEAGGADFVTNDDKLLSELRARQKDHDEEREKRRSNQEWRKDIRRDLGEVIKDNQRAFERKFEAQRVLIEDVKVTVHRESDRVIDAVLGGPHERIIDRDLHAIWKEMGWKGSVKARYLVLALHDYFSQLHRDNTSRVETLDAIKDITSRSRSESDSRKMEEITSVIAQGMLKQPKDEWALEYINIYRVQPLIEALDDDVSSFVTITEVNAFTAARPENWSLPHWIAYWTVGFELSVRWYHKHIIRLLSRFSAKARAAHFLPSNRGLVSRFLDSETMDDMHTILAGLVNHEETIPNPVVFERFKDYVFAQEKRMKKVLELLKYNIDDENTLTLVAGTGRPEKYLLPVLYLLLTRAEKILNLGFSTKLHNEELDIIEGSIWWVVDAAWKRAYELKAVFKLQNLDIKEQAKKFFFGMYRGIFEDGADVLDDMLLSSNCSQRRGVREILKSDHDLPEADTQSMTGTERTISTIDKTTMREGTEVEDTRGWMEVPLYYGAQTNLLFGFTQTAPNHDLRLDPLETKTPSLIGYWSGYHILGENYSTGSLITFSFFETSSHSAYNGSSSDHWGDCTVHGVVNNQKVCLDRQYLFNSDFQEHGTTLKTRYIGSYDDKQDKIVGTFGLQPEHDDTLTSTIGTFVLWRRPPVWLYACPDLRKLETEYRSRTLWKIAINAVRQSIHPWGYVRHLRDCRTRFVGLALEQLNTGAYPKETEFQEFIWTTPPEFIRHWRAIAISRWRNTIDHDYSCSNCDKDLLGTRLVCLDCTPMGYFTSISLCTDCINCNINQEQQKIYHSASSHRSLLQVRTNLPVFGELERRKQAISAVNAYLDNPAPFCKGVDHRSDSDCHNTESASLAQCSLCNSSISDPFWQCLDCASWPTIICTNCNSSVERQQPWLSDRIADTTGQHSWFHSLVRISPQVRRLTYEARTVKKGDDHTTRLEERLDELSKKFETFEQSTTSKLENIEQLLTQLLTLLPKKDGM